MKTKKRIWILNWFVGGDRSSYPKLGKLTDGAENNCVDAADMNGFTHPAGLVDIHKMYGGMRGDADGQKS